MEQRSYGLAQYEIILIGSGEIWWKAHGGFGDTKSGKCFIEGNVLFIGPSEESEPGSLKNEFLNHPKQLPPWDRTKYYCPSYITRSTPVKVGEYRMARNEKEPEPLTFTLEEIAPG